MSRSELVWAGPNALEVPVSCSEPSEIVAYAHGLTSKQQTDIARAFEHQAYDMGAEYTWRRAMIKLKATLKTLGASFIGEMLNDPEIDEFSNLDIVLNDYSAINLAEQLGAINSTGALKLRQALETLSHYLSDEAEKNGEELPQIEAASIVLACVKFVLGQTEISIAIEFSELRKRLFSESLSLSDPQIEQLVESPPFYIKTVISILLSGIRTEQGAAQEHAVGNLSAIIQPAWVHLPEQDKWQIGNAYRDAISSGNIAATKGLKNALMKVKGFDYVPENLRSNTFKKAAKSVLDAHFAMNNFYTEPTVVASLSKLGSSIPAPAFIECLQAYFCVYLGNAYGVSHAAVGTAENELKKVPEDRWRYYFSKVIATDDMILSKLCENKPRERFCRFATENFAALIEAGDMPTDVVSLLKYASKNEGQKVAAAALKLRRRIREK